MHSHLFILASQSFSDPVSDTNQDPVKQFKSTTTYVRCYYRDNSGPLKLGTKSLWAKVDGRYYALTGSWDNPDSIILNAFHTKTQYSDIEAACNTSLKDNHITARLAGMAAANNNFSWDYRINSAIKTNQTGYNKIIAIGDSLSDLHNAYIGSLDELPNSSSWYWGRFSNGPIWVEQLADLMKLPLDSYGQGNSRTETVKIGNVVAYFLGIEDQIKLWAKTSAKDPDADKSKMLFTLMIGGNDLAQTDASPAQVSARVKSALALLASYGAKNIVLLNVPDITKSPYYIKYRTDRIEADKKRLNEYNADLAEVAQQITATTDAKVTLFDTNKLFAEIIDNPAKYGMTLINDSCLDVNENLLMFLTSHSLSKTCTDPNKTLFWDPFHPTTRAGQIWAEAMFKQITGK